jgi:uncharacterized membrane protein
MGQFARTSRNNAVVGAGRTLAFASDCAPHWGSPEFVAWEGYGPFWRRAVHWLARL